MKAYHVPSIDGLVEAIVAAPTLAEAAGALGITVRAMRELHWQPIKGTVAAKAKAQPGQPLYRNIIGGPGRWEKDRAAAVARASRAAMRSLG